jgi:hypothetical protein
MIVTYSNVHSGNNIQWISGENKNVDCLILLRWVESSKNHLDRYLLSNFTGSGFQENKNTNSVQLNFKFNAIRFNSIQLYYLKVNPMPKRLLLRKKFKKSVKKTTVRHTHSGSTIVNKCLSICHPGSWKWHCFRLLRDGGRDTSCVQTESHSGSTIVNKYLSI